MYDELVMRLRNHAIRSDSGYEIGNSMYLDILKAADAIKELQKRVPKWIPVTERLPDSKKETYWVCTNTGYQCECRWTNNKYGLGESDKWGWNIIDTPQYQTVIAWQELPDSYEPPKEG